MFKHRSMTCAIGDFMSHMTPMRFRMLTSIGSMAIFSYSELFTFLGISQKTIGLCKASANSSATPDQSLIMRSAWWRLSAFETHCSYWNCSRLSYLSTISCIFFFANFRVWGCGRKIIWCPCVISSSINCIATSDSIKPLLPQEGAMRIVSGWVFFGIFWIDFQLFQKLVILTND